MRRRSIVLLVLAAVGLSALIAILAAVSGDSSIEATTAAVTRGSISRQLMVTGTLRPAKTVDVGARISGTIQSLDADFNTRVRAGQVIARLDPAIYQSALLEAQGRLAQAEADRIRLGVLLDDARVKLARAEELAAGDLIPASELETVRMVAHQAAADLKAVRAEMAAARATVDQAQVSLNHTIIRSPIDGVVISRSVDVGQTLAASLQTPVLFSIADLGRMQLLAEVSEADVGGIRSGAPVMFRVESVGTQDFAGAVSDVRLQPVIEQAVATSGSGRASAAAPTSGTSSQSTAGTTAQGSGTSAQSSATTTGSTAGQSTSGTTSAASASSTSQPTSPAAGVVSYTAVIDVDNSDGRLAPGGTAIITVPGAIRDDAIRLPNNALTFRPAADVLEAIGQDAPSLDTRDQNQRPQLRSATRKTRVWKFENGRFLPVAVEVGLADDYWTELVSGDIRPGDALVVRAARK